MRLIVRKISLYLLILICLNIIGMNVADGFMFLLAREALAFVDIAPEMISHGGGYTDVVEIFDPSARRVKGSNWMLVRLDNSGKYMRSRKLLSLGIDPPYGFEDMYTTASGDIYLSAINEDGTNTLYFMKDGIKKAKRCFSTSRNSTEKITSIVEQEQKVTFLVRGNNSIRAYRIDDDSTTTLIAEFDTSTLKNGDDIFYVFGNGNVVKRENNKIIYNNRVLVDTGADMNVTKVWVVDNGIFYMDTVEGKIYAMYMSSSEPIRYEDIFSRTKGATCINVDIKGDVWVIDNSRTISHFYSHTFEDLTNNIVRPRYISILITIGFELLILLLTTLLWFLIAVTWRMHYSFVIRWGALLLLALYIFSEFLDVYYYDVTRKALEKETFSDLNTLNYGNPTTETLRKIRHDFRVILFEKDTDDGIYYKNSGGYSNIETLSFGASFEENIKEAFKSEKENEMFNTSYFRNGKIYYVSAVMLPNNNVRSISIREILEKTATIDDYKSMMLYVRCLFIILWLIMVLLLVRISARITGVSHRTRHILSERHSYFDGYGDEISELNDSLNSTGLEVRDLFHKMDEHRKCYEKFMPKNVVELLGVKEAYDINLETCSVHELIMMTVSFKLDMEMYSADTKDVFARLNNLVGRSSRILNEHGGTVLDFRHDGFAALFKEKNPDCVVAAVKIVQEFQNEGDVTVHVAIDSNTVMSGVIGDEMKMQPIAISRSYATSGKILAFFDKIEAGILCTDKIYGLVRGYMTRFVGKVEGSDSDIRIYEIYDGDLPEIVAKKQGTEKLFLDAVYSFYSGDYKTAKAEFLQTVRENPHDGIAKYYLYLADSYESNGERKVSYLE